jgi:hypothetical protein
VRDEGEYIEAPVSTGLLISGGVINGPELVKHAVQWRLEQG